MPISTKWLVPDHVIYSQMSDAINLDEMRECFMLLRDMANGSKFPLVHVIMDVGEVTHPVAPKDSLAIVRQIGPQPKVGWNIVLREKSLLMRLGTALGTSIFKARTRNFDSLEEAKNFLRQIDNTIDWTQVDHSVLEQGV
jgi:hypothetical protein